MSTNKLLATLFLLSSLDGKISTGDIDSRDTDKDYHKIGGIKDGLQQYYDLEQKTDLVSLNTGRVMAKIGVNTRKNEPKKMIVDFVIIDSKPHLNTKGLIYLTKWVKTLYLVTNNKNHPAFKLKKTINNLEIIYYPKKINFEDLFVKLNKEYKSTDKTLQSTTKSTDKMSKSAAGATKSTGKMGTTMGKSAGMFGKFGGIIGSLPKIITRSYGSCKSFWCSCSSKSNRTYCDSYCIINGFNGCCFK